ncbi:hypothetical protein AMK68_04655, partial [candidate division KD3-62 bacterium DG_56]
MAGVGGNCVGDGLPATEAVLREPGGLAVGPDGSVYIADYGHDRVRKVDPEGIITTAASSGLCTVSGFPEGRAQRLWQKLRDWVLSADGVPATDTCLARPTDVVLAPDGSLYIAEWYRVRKVDANGIITTVAGGGHPADGVGDDGPAVEAAVSPYGLALGPDGSLYIAEGGVHRVRKVDPAGMITTVAGDGWMNPGVGHGRFQGDGGPAIQASLNHPYDVAVAPDGTLYIADLENVRVRQLDRHGIITTYAGTENGGDQGDGGPAREAALGYAWGLATGPDGTLYIAEGSPIRAVTPDGVIHTVAPQAVYQEARAVAVGPKGRLYFTATDEGRVYRAEPDGTLRHIAGAGGSCAHWGDGGRAEQAALCHPFSVAAGPDDSFYIAGTWNDRIRRVDKRGVITTVAGGGAPANGLGDGGPAVAASLDLPTSVAVGPDGSVYVADCSHHRIRKVDPQGVITTVAGTGLQGYSGDGGPATAATLDNPRGVCVSMDGSIYIADMDNHCVRKVDRQGAITT